MHTGTHTPHTPTSSLTPTAHPLHTHAVTHTPHTYPTPLHTHTPFTLSLSHTHTHFSHTLTHTDDRAALEAQCAVEVALLSSLQDPPLVAQGSVDSALARVRHAWATTNPLAVVCCWVGMRCWVVCCWGGVLLGWCVGDVWLGTWDNACACCFCTDTCTHILAHTLMPTHSCIHIVTQYHLVL